MRSGRGVTAGLVLLAGLTGCSAGHVPGGEPRTSPASTARASDHRAELARDAQTLKQVFPAPSDAVGLSQPEVATGADTAEGWQVRGFTAVNGFDVLRAGVHHVHVACVGNGSLTVTTRLAAGTATAPLPASSTSGQATRLVLDCTPEGAVSTTDFSLVDGDPGVELGVLPAAGTVAVAGYAIS